MEVEERPRQDPSRESFPHKVEEDGSGSLSVPVQIVQYGQLVFCVAMGAASE